MFKNISKRPSVISRNALSWFALPIKVLLAGLQLRSMSPTNSLKALKTRRNFERLSDVRLPRLSRSLPNLVLQWSFQILLNPENFKLYKFLDLLLLLRLFHFLLTLIFNSPFVPPDKSSLPTSALTAISEDTGLIRQPALFSTRQEVVSPTLAPVQRPQSQPYHRLIWQMFLQDWVQISSLILLILALLNILKALVKLC